MSKLSVFVICLFFIVSCKMLPGSDKQFDTIDKTKVYELRFNPQIGAKYSYDINTSSGLKLEVKDTKIDNTNKVALGVSYAISQDSLGNFLLNTVYDKIQISAKTAESETEIDADNAALSINPMEKMLGVLKTANMVATVSRSGEVKSVTGYRELTAKVMQNLGPVDAQTRAAAQTQWEQFVEKGVVRNSLEQLFSIFPDSAVHIGDRWKQDIKQSPELGLVAKSSFLLEEINDGIALITSVGDIKSDGEQANLMGQNVKALLKGIQKGRYEVNIKTGMIEKSRVTAEVEGTIEMMGKEIPVEVQTAYEITRRK